jgi:hypothetical protein
MLQSEKENTIYLGGYNAAKKTFVTSEGKSLYGNILWTELKIP